MGTLSNADMKILPLINEGRLDIGTDWYLRGFIPLWYQYAYHYAPQKANTFIAGIACVHGGTKIYDPIKKEGIPIADIVYRNDINVLSNYNGSINQYKANSPYLKGKEHLYKVKLSDGKEIITTLKHKFLAPSKYIALDELACGSLISVYTSQDQTTLIPVIDISYYGYCDYYDIHVPVSNNYVANGIFNHNSGKTVTSAASVMMRCLTTPYYKALHTSVTARQAELSFDMAYSWIEDNRKLEHLIKHISLRPYPVIEFMNYATWEFRTSGTDARFIRGSEYDRIVMDEAGLDPFGEVIKVLRGRLRGKRPFSPNSSIMVHRESRLDVITSPTDAVWLKERFYKGWKDNPKAELDKYFSIKARTYDNIHLTKEQVGMMESELTEEDVRVELEAEFPDYGLSFFSKKNVDVITEKGRYIYDEIYEAFNPENGIKKPGYDLNEHPRHGILKMEMPVIPGHFYIMAGDPGIEDPPKRNSSVVIVVDATIKPYKIVYFDWVYGRGKYDPFLTSYKYAINKYQPVYKALDTTAAQKGLQELAFEREDIETDGVSFGNLKDAMLNALSLLVSNQEIIWAPIKGLIKQMSIYTKEGDKKMPQDIVMTMAMIGYYCRFVPDADNKRETSSRTLQRSRKLRSRGSTGRRLK